MSKNFRPEWKRQLLKPGRRQENVIGAVIVESRYDGVELDSSDKG
jgi:hypothetical protein